MKITHNARRELWLFLGAYVLYTLGRFVAVADLESATANARQLIGAEEDLGVAFEQSVQGAFDGAAVTWLFSHVYLAAQFVILPGALFFLYRRSPAIYASLRNTIIATWALAVPIHALFPVAPPRLAGIGMADSVSHSAVVSLTGRSTMFYNEFAAVPSLHCGFACAVGIALALASQRRSAQLLALLWGPIVCLTVVVTANHYVLDIVAGLAVAGAGYVLGQVPAKLARIYRARDIQPDFGRIAVQPA